MGVGASKPDICSTLLPVVRTSFTCRFTSKSVARMPVCPSAVQLRHSYTSFRKALAPHDVHWQGLSVIARSSVCFSSQDSMSMTHSPHSLHSQPRLTMQPTLPQVVQDLPISSSASRKTWKCV